MVAFEFLIRLPVIIGIWAMLARLVFGSTFNPFIFVEQHAHLVGLHPVGALVSYAIWSAVALIWILMDMKRVVTQ